MTSRGRKIVCFVVAAAVTGLSALLLNGFAMAMVWECIHRVPGDRLYCGEPVLEAMPFIGIVMLAAVFVGSWWFTARWLRSRH